MSSSPYVEKALDLGKKFIGYPEERPHTISSKDWVRDVFRNPKDEAIHYVKRLFPILTWIGRYNVGWLTGDIIAGLTVGIVLVPQSMSYATIATLSPQYGLYSAFVGVMIYCLFATSKDVSIGPVAVMSLTVSEIIKNVNAKHPDQFDGPTIATAVAFIAGFIVLGIGLLRQGWLVELIPLPAVSGFMTGSAISIAAGQVPGLMGITGFDTRAATYEVIINTLKGLPRTKLDAAFGLTGLVVLYLIRYACDWATKRYPRRARWFFFISVFRNAFVIIVLTFASWLFCRHRGTAAGKYPIKILKTVPAGFRDVGPPDINPELLSAIAPQLPVATIILLLEHIAIAKSFGRVNGYKIDPNQELIAIGVTNTVGSVFHAYPATGSFSRSALKAKSGVRTPLAGILSGIIVVVALYGLTPAFFWIPTAGLSSIIIHAVADLVTKPKQAYGFWRISPLEYIIWLAAVLITIFSSIENGIYVSISLCAALMLIKLAHPRGYFLGRVRLHSEASSEARDVFVPIRPNKVLNPDVKVEPPHPGVIVYRFEESYLYPNVSIANDTLVEHVRTNMRRGKDMSTVSLADRAWNDPGPRRGSADEAAVNAAKPLLHAIVLDFSSVSQIDTTAVQTLIDTRVEVERWTDGAVEFHFASILSPWIRRALVAGGFGTGAPASSRPREIAPVVTYGHELRERRHIAGREGDAESGKVDSEYADSVDGLTREQLLPPRAAFGDHVGNDASLIPVDTPFFHLDLETAVRAAEAGVRTHPRDSSSDSDSVGEIKKTDA
ncbi:unnamed protein product [Peniophora sp. CBMAI 1063]|nr:unnamed protein product [Peniophora sp. CBMAI 1063]